jgi:hypothetical protein
MWISDLIQLFGDRDYHSALFVRNLLVSPEDGYTVLHFLPLEMLWLSLPMIQASLLFILLDPKNHLKQLSTFGLHFFHFSRCCGRMRMKLSPRDMIANRSSSTDQIKDGMPKYQGLLISGFLGRVWMIVPRV